MPLQKEYYYAGNSWFKKFKDSLTIIIGVMGALIIILGFTQTPAQLYYVIGSGLLLITAIYFKLTYFMALESILLSGHGAILLDLGNTIQLILPLLLCVQLLVYYFLSGQLGNIYRWIGILGIALLSIGFTFTRIWIFFLGSLCISIFSFYHVFRGRYVALIWATLNLFFALSTALIILF
ncbi:hypothetical protein [Legionella impletisoli]|uniref:Transmembrane protein n=1 Tax=Legionella impletisoli TaxID=343510 RepID=A0A917JM51_9GAMM|nr:hypothetical protein [Legionella impletisoli]GGI77085.1 hypothetical protein GCM10007966_02280 [Legionella impletisoli]